MPISYVSQFSEEGVNTAPLPSTMNEQMHQGDFLGGIQSLGLVNALKTGDVVTDILIAMCIPFLMRFIFTMVERSVRDLRYREWQRWKFDRSNKYQRFLVTKSTKDTYGGSRNMDTDTQNSVLIKAVQLYVFHKCKLNLEAANVDLTSVGSKNLINNNYYEYEDSYEPSSNKKTLAGILSKYSVVKKPLHNEWYKLGDFPCKDDEEGLFQFAVHLRIEESTEPIGKDGGSRLNTIRYHFVSPGPSSIDVFIETAYRWYMGELKSLEDNSRYLYEIQQDSISGGRRDSDDEDNDGGPIHVRYKLSDEKTFESLFFQQKQSLLNLVGNFTAKKGRYAIKGYPHKLGLLLHGPPGTGKTSLIKALAQHTGRSIVNVPLAKISTNSELMNIFFSKRYYVRGEDVPVELGFKDIIFVMEDVDACSRIVRRRDGKRTAAVTQTEQVDLPPVPKSIWRMLLESNEPDCRELVELLMTRSERLKEEALKPDVLRSLAQRMMVLPGLGLVGESGGEDALVKIGNEALSSANELMEGYSTVDRFVGIHARSIKALLDAGADVDDEFVDELLGTNVTLPPLVTDEADMVNVRGLPSPVSFSSIPKPNLSRELSYTKYGSDDEVHLTAVASENLVNGTTEASSDAKNDASSKTTDSGSSSVMVGQISKESPWSKIGKDKLNLTGLLNVLDGVVDTPGRILIMTTNHPEMLDPALIRPGRIDKKLMLGYMASADVIDMLQHYFQTTLTDIQRERVQRVISGDVSEARPQLSLTPAQVEQLTAEHDHVEDMISVLEKKAASIVASKMHIGKSSASSIRFNL